jgi:hypothetical protein
MLKRRSTGLISFAGGNTRYPQVASLRARLTETTVVTGVGTLAKQDCRRRCGWGD